MSSVTETSLDYIYAYDKNLKSLVDRIRDVNNLPCYGEPVLFTVELSKNRYRSTLCITFGALASYRCTGIGGTKKCAEKIAVDNLLICLTSSYPGLSGNCNPSIDSENSSGYSSDARCTEKSTPKTRSSKLTTKSNDAHPSAMKNNILSNAVGDQFDFIHRDIVNQFPNPLGELLDMYAKLIEMKRLAKDVISHNATLINNEWLGVISVKKPEVEWFQSVATSRKEAMKKSAVLCLEWLKLQKEMGIVLNNPFPEYKKENEKQSISPENQNGSGESGQVCAKEEDAPLDDIIIDGDLVEDAEELLNWYDHELSEKVKGTAVEWEKEEMSLITNFRNLKSKKTVSANQLKERNRVLYNNLTIRREKFIKHGLKSLPINEQKNKIIELIEKHSTVVIMGETGCGKSTQVPQFVFDEWTARGRGAECNVIVTQPRRIAAIALAERIAYERCEELMNVVGYQVRLQCKLPKTELGNIIFCSVGIMLRKVLSNPDLEGITHLIIDEAHERDLNTDFLLLLTKRAILRNPNLRVIVMSATLNPELFQRYFYDAPTVHVPGFTYPVFSAFLEKVLVRVIGLSPRVLEDCKTDADPKAVVKTILWLDESKPPGAILVFLPSWNRISNVMNELKKYNRLYVLAAHSRLSYHEQRKIFDRPPAGRRKVVLSTNIAETSITIDDIVYVVDSGIHKEERRNTADGMFCLDNQWVSQASALQRRGRAGRVQPGECYHLYTREKFDSLDLFPLPEIHRVSLETSILNSKIYSKNDTAESFLGQLPEPPSRDAIRRTVLDLQSMGLLDEGENLTPLGTRVSVFGTHPVIAMALIYSYIFKCVNPVLCISTLLSSDKDLYPGLNIDKRAIVEKKRRFSPSSDHLAMGWMYRQWEDYMQKSGVEARKFAEHYLGASHETFVHVQGLRTVIVNYLYECGFLKSDQHFDDLHCNQFSANDELVKGILLAGLQNILVVNKKVGKKNETYDAIFKRSGNEVTVYAESVNCHRTEYPSRYLTYFQEVRSLQKKTITVRETTLLSPLTLVLFHCNSVITVVKNATETRRSDRLKMKSPSRNQVVLQLKDKEGILRITCNKRAAEMLIRLRHALWEITSYIMREEGDPVNVDFHSLVKSFHERMLSLLNRILNEQTVNLDYDGEGNLRSNK